jgi:hypothetical protein
MGLVDARVEFSSEYSKTRQDPAFYVSDGPVWVASVYLDNRLLDIYCIGEMRLQLPTEDYPVRYTSELFAVGIEDDSDLIRISEKYRNYDIWQNNAWFELFTPTNNEYLDDEIFFNVDEAVDRAYTLLGDSEFLSKFPSINPEYKYPDQWRKNEVQ